MKAVSRRDALAWAVENITAWPTISDWANLKISTPQGWSFDSHRGYSLLILSAIGNYAIAMSDWMKAKSIEIPTREDALSWVVENLSEWPVSENTGAPAGWEWVRFVNPNFVSLVAENNICIQKKDWLQKKNDFNVNRQDGCLEHIFDKTLHFTPSNNIDAQFRAEVEVLLGGVPIITFADGTQQFCDELNGDTFSYSPRLLPDDMEKFCEINIVRYQQFNEKNSTQLDKFERIYMEPFW